MIYQLSYLCYLESAFYKVTQLPSEESIAGSKVYVD